MKKMNSLFTVSDDSSALPVCLENAWKSFTDPGSVKDFQAFSKQTGNALLASDTADNEFIFFMKKK